MTIESVDIIRTLRQLLTDNFSDKKVMLKDIKTAEPSCFYIRYVTGKENQTATEYFTDKSSYEIVYFSEEESDTELNLIKDKLKKLFRKPLKVYIWDEENEVATSTFRLINVNNVSINQNENDYFISCLIDLELTETDEANSSASLDDDTDSDYMLEDLILKIGDN